MKIATSYLRKI